ncbi:hypothetical protein Tdes44962_MAKER02323 [Teratosphaeria destructans]|uniref:Uncharacterized protein n=1 Tax=Teratosphaeria destructans TaxID=418781 RepID=A0A9W7W3N3_9PEZI|nr:hypothetical protein Tdes44962_MAKER02323 [Teratosphaeria destructans]
MDFGGACGQAKIYSHDCYNFCSFSGSLRDFLVAAGQNISQRNNPDPSVYCAGSISGNNTLSLNTTSDAKKSAGTRSRPPVPTFSFLIVAMLMAFLFITPTTASVLPESDLTTRQSGCSFKLLNNYTSSTNVQIVSPHYDFDCVPFCDQGINVADVAFNRTINSTSAAEPQYDAFFDILANSTGRVFPAITRMSGFYDIPYTSGSGSEAYYVFAGYLWCANGTVTGCAGTLGFTDATSPVTACGPLWVSEPTDGNYSTAIPAGQVWPVLSS